MADQRMAQWKLLVLPSSFAVLSQDGNPMDAPSPLVAAVKGWAAFYGEFASEIGRRQTLIG